MNEFHEQGFCLLKNEFNKDEIMLLTDEYNQLIEQAKEILDYTENTK